MNRKVLLPILLAAILATVFFPFTEQTTTIIKSPFLRLYSILASPEKWEKWRPELRKHITADSNKISIHKDTGAFTIKYNDLELEVKKKGNSFDINDHLGNKTANYSYTIVPVVDKFMNKTLITVVKKTTAISYIVGKIRQDPFRDTHISDLKTFMETDSLLYGFRIFKTGVPESFLIVTSKEVLNKDKFTEAATLIANLRQYVKTHDVKQMQPLIAQFSQTIKDAVQVKVGLFINKEVKTEKDITFNRMPKGGPLYAVTFTGTFKQRSKAYIALKQYYLDQNYQLPLLPFEVYLNNKLPKSDTDKVNIQLNFSGLF